MDTRNNLIEKLYQAASLISCDARAFRTYGTDNTLTYSDITFLKCIERKVDTKAGEISNFLGITNGAVAQFSKKLIEKGYLEVYRLSGNKKEVYYRLTQKGGIACAAYDDYYNALNQRMEHYIQGLDEKTIQDINGFFDTLISGINIEKDCYIKGSCDDTTSAAEGRCEKCRKVY